MTTAVVFAYRNVGVFAAPRRAQPWGGRGKREPGLNPTNFVNQKQ